MTAGARFGEDTRAVVLTVSDGCFHGAREDRSGPAVVELQGVQADQQVRLEVY